ncbi:MAG: glycosyltransferase family 9 protein [Candidatus Zixiibacteriota bacterium]
MRILIIRYSSLGDVVLATGPLHTLLDALPDSELIFVTKPTYGPLLQHLPPQVSIPRLDPEQPLVSAWKQLRGQVYDWIIDLHGSLRSVTLAHLLRSKRQTRIDKNVRRRRAMVKSKQGLDHPLSTLSVYHDALAPLGIGDRRALPQLGLSPAEGETVRIARESHPRTLGIGWGARWPTKAVPNEIWPELLSQVAPGTLSRALLFAEPQNAADLQQFAAVVRERNPGLAIDTLTSADWREVMTGLASCAAYTGSDSGLMHVADALGVPTFGLFGPTHPALGFAPSGPRSRAFHAGTWCSPCHRHGAAPCFRGHRYCFDELDLSSIASAIQTVLTCEKANR